MKKIICIIITATLLFTSAETAFAKNNHAGKHDNHKKSNQHCNNTKEEKQEFKIKESPVIKYGRYKLPILPITKGMGATVTFDKYTTILTVTKGNISIVINFRCKTVKTNGVADNNSGIFTARNDKKMTVLIKYIAKVLGVIVDVDEDEVTVENPVLDLPSNIIVSPVGTTVIANTLNSTTLYMTASATITAGQATGGKAELYVGSKLIATDVAIASVDSTVTFTTSDNTPTNAELQATVPVGGVVTVKIYNANNNNVVSKVANPTLIVDYIIPTITSITSAIYSPLDNQLKFTVNGASAIGDKVDVTKITLYDSTIGKSYQLTNTSGIGSNGVVKSINSLEINIGTADKLGLTGFGSSTLFLVVSDSLLKDAAGNSSTYYPINQTVPVTVASRLDLPTKVTILPVGTTVIANTLNNTTHYLTAIANITVGQAAGGKAELYVGSKLVATDAVITASDTTVTFTTSDYTPTNAELQLAVPSGGLVTVKLFNSNNNYAISAVANPTLVVDYVAPIITGFTSAIYNAIDNQIYLMVTGAGAIGDKVDVTKVSLFDTNLNKTYQLTNTSGTGSKGVVNSSNSLVINLGSTDKLGLKGFGVSTVSLTISVGSLLSDAAGNTSTNFTTLQTISVIVIK